MHIRKGCFIKKSAKGINKAQSTANLHKCLVYNLLGYSFFFFMNNIVQFCLFRCAPESSLHCCDVAAKELKMWCKKCKQGPQQNFILFFHSWSQYCPNKNYIATRRKQILIFYKIFPIFLLFSVIKTPNYIHKITTVPFISTF